MNDPVGLPAALVAPHGAVRWQDDDWRERRGCFVGGTPVWTPVGPVPIEDVQVGPRILPGKRARSTQTRAYRRRARAVVERLYARDSNARDILLRRIDESTVDHRLGLGLGGANVQSNLRFMDAGTNNGLGGQLSVASTLAPAPLTGLRVSHGT